MDYNKLAKIQEKFLKSHKLLNYDFDLSKETEKSKEIIKSYQKLCESGKQFSMFSIEIIENISYQIKENTLIIGLPHIGDVFQIDNTKLRIFLKDGSIITKKGYVEIYNCNISSGYFSNLYMHQDTFYKIKLGGIKKEDIKSINFVTKLGFLTSKLRRELAELNDNFQKIDKE